MRWLLLTAGGLGHLRPASGTWGSLPSPIVALGLVWLLGSDGDLSSEDHAIISTALVLLVLLFSITCVRFGADAEARFGRSDPGEVVADEVAGQALALLGLPWRAFAEAADARWNLAVAATAFVAFRFFDITKLPPASGLQRRHGGWGILLDDLVAGVYALVVAQLVARVLLPQVL